MIYRWKYIYTFALLLVMISTGLCKSASESPLKADSLVYLKNPNYLLQTGMYDIYQTRHADIVMLGNSITHGVNWNELMNRGNIVERGIPSDILNGYLSRMSYIYKLTPKLCCIMGGVNDIYSGIPIETVFNNYIKVIGLLKNKGITPVIQSTLFVSTKWPAAKEKSPEIAKLNKMLSEYAFKNKIDFLDLNSKMAFNGLLFEDITYDGVHLNAKGYKIWAKELDKVLKRYGL